jgi:hypothetical protein
MMKRFALLLILALPAPGSGQAILNVEGLRGEEVEGVHGELSGRLRLASGNTDLQQMGADVGLGALRGSHWFRGYLGLDRLEREGKDILDNRYLHLRYNYVISERLRTFHFFQVQSNENLLLNQRRLLGSGLRYRLIGGENNRLEVGLGLMWESEHLNEAKLQPEEEPDSDVLRMANLVVGSGSFGEGRRWVTVVYYQPSVEGLEDYRLAGDFGLGIELIASLQLDVALTWRHDSRAPAGLDDDDVGFKTGFTYRIR